MFFEGLDFKKYCRYATWLELYARLDAEERAGVGRERLAQLTIGILEHEEGFLDRWVAIEKHITPLVFIDTESHHQSHVFRYRCLSCWDGGMRSAALDREEEGQV